MIEKIRECYNVFELSFNEEAIDSAHRVGKEYMEKSKKRRLNQYL